TASPIALYALQHPTEFFARMEQVSIFNQIQEVGDVSPLYSNVAKHLLMFNAAGDPNGRHNLPGAPMLDPLTGALFVAGLLYCLARPWQPTATLRVAWVPLMLSGGVFSLDFEAPQGLRCLDEVIAVAALAAVPFAALWSSWIRIARAVA